MFSLATLVSALAVVASVSAAPAPVRMVTPGIILGLTHELAYEYCRGGDSHFDVVSSKWIDPLDNEDYALVICERSEGYKVMAAQLELVQAFKPQLPYYLGPIENGVLPYLDQICAKAADEGVTPNQSVCLDAYYAHLDEMESA